MKSEIIGNLLRRNTSGTEGSPPQNNRKLSSEFRRLTPVGQAHGSGRLPNYRNSIANYKSILSQKKRISRTPTDMRTNSTTSFFTGEQRDRAVTFYDFKGLIAPVFTCFRSDEERTLNFEFIERYAEWLKSNNVSGVLVNSSVGEGYAMTANERKMHAEFWWLCAQKHDLLCMIYIGSAPLPDILESAQHADDMGVHAVVCSFDIFNQPKNLTDLLAYCGTIAENCRTRPFFYHHNPKTSPLNLLEFCETAEAIIPNFFGVHFTCFDLDEGARCLRTGRAVVLNARSMIAAGLLIGFEAIAMTCVNMCPELCFDIMQAMKANDLPTAKAKQRRLCDYVWTVTGTSDQEDLSAMKMWFNDVMESNKGAGFSAGPTRSSF